MTKRRAKFSGETKKELTSKGKGVFLIVFVGLVDVVDDQRCTKSIHILAQVMTVDPVGTRLARDWDRVREVGTWRERALGHHRGAVHLVVTDLEKTVGVQTGWHIELVDSVDDHSVIESDIDRWWSIASKGG